MALITISLYVASVWLFQALLYKFHGDNDKALSLWTRIADGQLEDDIFPGIDFIVEYLAK